MIRVRKIDDQMMYYGCGTTFLEIKNAVVVVVFIFLNHSGFCGRVISSSELWQVDSTSGQKQSTIFTIYSLRRK